MKNIFVRFKKYALDLWEILKMAGGSFSDHNTLKFSASLSYYTIFSLAPTLIVIIAVSGIFYGEEAIQGKLYGQIDQLIGKDAAKQVQDLIKSAHRNNQDVFATILGLITLFIGATGVFLEIQSTINFIWRLKTKPKKGIIKFIFGQLISFSMVVSLGFLLLVTLALNTLLDLFLGPLQTIMSGYTIYIIGLVNLGMTFVIITLLFFGIFKVLPDGNMRIKDAVIGAGFTAILFMIGRYLIGLYLSYSSTMSVYGSAGSIILILLWVYYCSIILYFGAEFTKAHAIKFGKGITPKSYAMFVDEYKDDKTNAS